MKAMDDTKMTNKYVHKTAMLWVTYNKFSFYVDNNNKR